MLPRRLVPIALACAAAVLAATALVACSPDPTLPPPTAPGDVAGAGTGELDLATPEAAVLSYLARISDAYRTGDSSVASATMTADEFVRVDAYIELNRQRNRRIDQSLDSFTKRSESVDATRATVEADEAWQYAYVALDTGRPSGPPNSVTYRTRYELAREGDLWKVSSVVASATSPVP